MKKILLMYLLITNNIYLFSSENNNKQNYDDFFLEIDSDNDSNPDDIRKKEIINCDKKEEEALNLEKLDQEFKVIPKEIRNIILNYIYQWEKHFTLNLGDSVKCAAFSPDSKYLISTKTSHHSNNRAWIVLKKFDCADWQNENNSNSQFPTSQGQTSVINSIAYLQKGKYIVSGSEDGYVRVFESDIESFKLITCDTMPESITCLDVSPLGFLAAASKNWIKIWNFNDYHIKKELASCLIKEIKNDYNVISIAYSPNKADLSYSCIDGKLMTIDSKTGNSMSEINIGRAIGKSIYSLAYSPIETRLAAGTGNIITIINTNDNSEITLSEKTQANNKTKINAISYCKDGSLLFLGFNNDFNDSHVEIWDTKCGKFIEELILDDKIYFVICSNDNKYLAIGSGQNIIIYKNSFIGRN